MSTCVTVCGERVRERKRHARPAASGARLTREHATVRFEVAMKLAVSLAAGLLLWGCADRPAAEPVPARRGPPAAPPPPPVREVAKWSMLEITLAGPPSRTMDAEANPFAIPVDVVFSGPGGTFTVPAFYDGDGAGGPDGNAWKARFGANAAGRWTWTSRSGHPLLAGRSGSFEVVGIPDGAPVFARRGRLQGRGEHYLRFAEGGYWLKSGADDPEDFLANPELPTLADKLEAIDFLADRGINSLYVVTMNIDGDGRNVWPWVGATEEEAKRNHRRFDVARLAGWETVFAHLQARGLLVHLVLEDDSAWNGFDRALYYREMVARFGHLNGLVWNLCEEFNERYTHEEMRSFATRLRALDPYDHPIAVHQAGSTEVLRPFFDDVRFDLTSFQTEDVPQNGSASFYWGLADEDAHVIAVSFDETGKLDPTERDKARHIAWSVYLGGGNFELHTWPIYEGRFTYEDYADLLADTARARRFLEAHVPFWEMAPRNDLLVGTGYLFARPGRDYVVYAPSGGPLSVDLGDLPTGVLRWFDPARGTLTEGQAITGGGVVALPAAPFEGDVVALIQAD